MTETRTEVDQGLATLNEDQLRVLRQLDEVLLGTAQAHGAREIGFAPLSSVASLERINYFQNFPHLGLAVAPLNAATTTMLAGNGDGVALDGSLQPEQLAAPRYLLPSAACYPIYHHLRHQALETGVFITTVQRCYRNEDRYQGLERLLAFTMREFVLVGQQAAVRDFLATHKQWVRSFAERLGLALTLQLATDPFFESGGQRARMQQLFPVKEEFVFDGRVAVASLNFHRNFFGERWNIRTSDGEYAFTGCVAFGLERWLHALSTRWGGDAGAMLDALAALSAARPPS